jgi:hypothetical protein
MRATGCAVVLACGLLAIGGCSKHEQAADAGSPQTAEEAAAAAPAAMLEVKPETRSRADAPVESPAVESQLQSAAASQDDGERKFIRTAAAEFRVREVYGAALAIEDLAAQHGGFVVRNDIRSDVDEVRTRPSGDGNLIELATYTVRGQLQVRVPSARTQAFMRALAAQVEFLDNRTFAATDAQFELLRQQLAYARHEDAQRALGEVAAGPGKLGEKAQAVDARAQSQAERDEALIARRTFEDRVAFATIDLSLYQTPRVRHTIRMDVEEAARRDGPGFFPRLGHALSAGWFGLLDTAVALSQLWPLWLALAAAAVLIRRRRRS